MTRPLRKIECEHEAEILAAVASQRYPDRVSAELRQHAAACEICADAAAVAAAFRDDEELTPSSVRLPDSSVVWWRAQLRAREEAARTAGRPITITQAIAACCGVGVVGALFGATSSWFQGWISSGWSAVKSILPAIQMPTLSVPSVVTTLWTDHALLVTAVVAVVVVAPVAVYFAVREADRASSP